MQRSQSYSHHHAEEVLRDKGILDEVLRLPDQPNVAVVAGSSPTVKRAFRRTLVSNGWAMGPRVHDDFNLTINAIKSEIGLTVQTANIARAFYDLMKFQVMYINNRIEGAVLIVPNSAAASVFGNNIANFTRVSNEISLFRHVVTVPCLLLSFE